ncbi:hypothetical protein TIFTF001_031928 [Ficus carica]|uniref:Uncharacterized protein n=1 Tax=Ficus carica TaxID=3494 RepID=A0AA88J512_FICCA|nr:hypothetical protein TIFTF001_031928 [Ficus carica]
MVVTKVTSQPMRMRRLASCRAGFTWPCPGNTTRRKRGFAIECGSAWWAVEWCDRVVVLMIISLE